ncbi:hypothetical protein G6F42_018207 [Rhizopus arrhizus]|nr:hypothetical protein G6F42_018207 [Rhizopus arrhizus]
MATRNKSKNRSHLTRINQNQHQQQYQPAENKQSSISAFSLVVGYLFGTSLEHELPPLILTTVTRRFDGCIVCIEASYLFSRCDCHPVGIDQLWLSEIPRHCAGHGLSYATDWNTLACVQKLHSDRT